MLFVIIFSCAILIFGGFFWLDSKNTNWKHIYEICLSAAALFRAVDKKYFDLEELRWCESLAWLK